MSEENIFDFIEDVVETDKTSEFIDEEDLFEFDAEFDIQLDEDADENEVESIQEEGIKPIEEKGILYDTLYIYGKAWKEEAKSHVSNQYRRITTESYFKDKNSTEKTAISKAFNSCIAPIISEMGERGLFKTDIQMRDECNALFSHLMLTTIESINTAESKKPAEYMDKWAQYLVKDNDKLRFKGGLLLLPSIVMKISPEEAWSIFNSYVANLEDTNKLKQRVPEDLSKLLLDYDKYITKAPKSKPVYGGFQTLSITTTDSYIRNIDSDISEQFNIAKILQVDSSGLIVTECTCGSRVDMTKSISVILKSGRVRNSDSMYFKLRPCACPNCGTEMLIEKDLLKPLASVLCEDLGRNAKANNLMTEACMNYATLFTVVSETKESDKISLDIMPEENVHLNKNEFKNELLDFLNCQKDIQGSLSNYQSEIAIIIMNKNGCKFNIKKVVAYVFAKMSEDERNFILQFAYKNIAKFQKYVDYKVVQEIEILREENSSVTAEFVSNGDKVLNIKKVPKIKEPYTEFTAEEKERLLDRLEEILQDDIDFDVLLSCDLDKELEELMHFSRLGVLIEDLLFTNKPLWDYFVSNAFSSLLQSILVSDDKPAINLPQRTRVLSQEKKLILSMLASGESIDVDFLYRILCHDINSFKPVAYKEYKLMFKPVFKLYKPKSKIVLNGIMGDEAEYLLQLKNVDKIIKEFIIQQEFDDSGKLVKLDTSLSLEPRNILLLAILRAFSADRWENQEMHSKLLKRFDEVL